MSITLNSKNLAEDGVTTISTEDLNDLIEPAMANDEIFEADLNNLNSLSTTADSPSKITEYTTLKNNGNQKLGITQTEHNRIEHNNSLITITKSHNVPCTKISEYPSRFARPVGPYTMARFHDMLYDRVIMTYNEFTCPAFSYTPPAGYKIKAWSGGLSHLKIDSPDYKFPQFFRLVAKMDGTTLRYRCILIWIPHVNRMIYNHSAPNQPLAYIGDHYHVHPGNQLLPAGVEFHIQLTINLEAI